MEKTPGDRIGPYEILSLVGAGGMGEVYRARDSRLKREVAIKFLPSDFVSNPERQKRFQREAETTSALNHPNIVSVYDIGSQDGSQYIVSELVQGESLRKLIVKGPVPIKRLLDIAIQIADGLGAAHQAGIVHRDLKPENIMITPDQRVKILDFGLAKLIQSESLMANADTTSRSLTGSGIIHGTISYMSPEQASGSKVDFRSDQFSLGVLMYEMATGKRPFDRPTVAQTLAAIISEDLPAFPATGSPLPAPLRWIIERCLAKDRAQRYESTADLQRELSTVRAHLSEVSSGALQDVKNFSEVKAQRKTGYWLPLLAGLLIGSAVVAFVIWRLGLAHPVEKSMPALHRMTFRRGTVYSARFVPGSHNIVYSAAWDGNPPELYTGVPGSPEYRSIGLQGAQILSISRSGEMAVLLGAHYDNPDVGLIGKLVRMPFSGGAPRELQQNVFCADWTPDGKELAVVRYVNDTFRLEFPLGNALYESRDVIRDVRISPTGKELAFLDARLSDFAVTLLEPSGNKKVLSSGWDYVWGLVWAPSGNELFFGASKSKLFAKEIYGVSLSGKTRLVFPLTGDLRMQDVSHEGQLLTVVNSDRTQMNVSPAGVKGERDLSWFDWTLIRDLTNDGKLALFDEIGEGTGGNKDNAYIRNVDNPSAVHLAEANPFEFSPDEKWILARASQNTPLNSKRLMLIPIGTGESRELPHGPIEEYAYATWFPDGKRIAFAGIEKNHGFRIYVQEIDGKPPVAITKENIQLPYRSRISPDGKSIVGVEEDGTIRIYPVEGGEGRTVPGLEKKRTNILGWTSDGTGLYMSEGFGVPLQIYLLNPVSGKKVPWKEFVPSDPAGVVFMFNPCIAPDGKSYAYSYERMLSELYLIDGFK